VLQSHGGSRIRLFLELEHDFSSATGVRFAANLRNLGGNRAVLGALRRFPASSAQIFDVSAYLNAEAAETVVLPERAGAFSLVGSDTFGELDVRALLAVFQVPRLDHVGDGWAGGRSGVYRDPAGRTAVVLAFAWKGTVEAQRWGEAVTTYVNEAFEPDVPGFPATIPCSVDVCWSIAGRGIAARRIGSRTALAIASDVPTAAQLATFAIPR
jgi:hypothetical protein